MLSDTLSCTTIKGRKEILQAFLQRAPVGALSVDEDRIIKELFHRWYEPDAGERKYRPEEILNFFVGVHPVYHTKGFHMTLCTDVHDVATLRRLAGEGRTQTQNLIRALREAIRPQIETFRYENPLVPTYICPITGSALGHDAQVDHYSPTFRELVKEWRSGLADTEPAVHSSKTHKSVYELEEPFHTSWVTFHKTHAVLRWLSKEGNQRWRSGSRGD